MNNLNNQRYQYKLFVDELGVANPKAKQSEVYILSGCFIDESKRRAVEDWANHIKFKYWGRTDVVFHSREIGRKGGVKIKFLKRHLMR